MVALFACAQSFRHAADLLFETAVLLACLLLPVALQQLGSPLLELVDRDLTVHILIKVRRSN